MNNIKSLARAAFYASRELAGKDTETKNLMLSEIADAIEKSADIIIKNNSIDIGNAQKAGKDKTFIDRLSLNDKRIKAMADGVRAIINLTDPVGEKVEDYTLDNGLNVTKVRAPLGVVAIIYEARPNVTVDCAALTLKSGNSVILRGSKDAINSNRALYNIIRRRCQIKAIIRI